MFADVWDSQTKAVVLKYDHLRYRLMPYIYSLAGKVTRENYTIMRSLIFDFKNDTAVNNVPDQYMFGPAFLVNPVTDNGSRSRSVYLPKQTTWYDFWTGKTIDGGQTIKADAPIETMPLYVKAGSIVPMGPYVQYATEKPADPIELRIYPGADGSFTIYEDENDNYNYEKGMYSTITLHWNDKTKTLTIDGRKGSFPGMLKTRTFKVVLVKENHGAGVEPCEKADKIITYNGIKKMLNVAF